MKTLKNTALTLNISLHGAELTSIRDSFGREFLWQADPAFWKRYSPVLFPIVGSLWDKHFRVNGREYEMGQHGFARDMDFRLVSEREDEMWFELKSSPETLAKYPYEFTLRIGYRLEANKIHVKWEVSGPKQFGSRSVRTLRSICRGLCMGVARVFPVRIPVPVLVL